MTLCIPHNFFSSDKVKFSEHSHRSNYKLSLDDLVGVPFEDTDDGTEIMRLIEKVPGVVKDREQGLRRVVSAKPMP